MSLNDSKIRNLKPSAKPFKVSDSNGLYLLIKPGGSRHWYLKYRINGKESRIALGATRHSRGLLNAEPAHQRRCLKQWRWHGIKTIKSGRRTPLTVCLPA